MKKFIEEFRAFALRGNVMDMAVGVIIGGAFYGIVTSLTDNFINPVLNMCTGHEMYTLQDMAGFVSSFLSSVVNFVIMAFILFCLMKQVRGACFGGFLQPGAPFAAGKSPTARESCQAGFFLRLAFLFFLQQSP